MTKKHLHRIQNTWIAIKNKRNASLGDNAKIKCFYNLSSPQWNEVGKWKVCRGARVSRGWVKINKPKKTCRHQVIWKARNRLAQISPAPVQVALLKGDCWSLNWFHIFSLWQQRNPNGAKTDHSFWLRVYEDQVCSVSEADSEWNESLLDAFLFLS